MLSLLCPPPCPALKKCASRGAPALGPREKKKKPKTAVLHALRHGEHQDCDRLEHTSEQRCSKQEQERLSSGAAASTSGADTQLAGTKRSIDKSGNSISSSQQSRDGLLQSLFSNKHDAMILNLALPSLLSLAADPLLAITDTAFVGQLGNNELAAFSVNTSLFTFAFLVFNFLSTATTPAVATAIASNDKQKAGQTVSQALLLAGLLGGIAAGTLTLQATPVLQLMGIDPQDDALFNIALQFLYIRATAAPAALLISVSQGVFRGCQDMRTPLGVTVAMNILHLGLSVGLIFQAQMGLSGAALSISASEWAAAAVYLAIGWTRREQLGLGQASTGSTTGSSAPAADPQSMRGSYTESSSSSSSSSSGERDRFAALVLSREASTGLASYDAELSSGFLSSSNSSSSNNTPDLSSGARELPGSQASDQAREDSRLTSAGKFALETLTSYVPFLQAGGAVLLRTGLLLGTKTLASAVAMRLGPEQMSTHQILYQVWLLSSLAVDSLAIAGQVAVAVSLGRGDLVTAREVSNRLLQLGMGLGGLMAAVLFIAEPVWPRAFTQETDIVAAVQTLAPLALGLLPINSIVYVLDGVFVGANDYNYLVKAMVVAAMLGTPLLLAVQPLNWGLDGVWWGLSALMLGRCLSLLYRYNSPSGPVPPLPPLALPNGQVEDASSTLKSVDLPVRRNGGKGDRDE